MSEVVGADVAVVGAGPAGIAAAVTASEAGARVVLVDQGLAVGGQIWRAPALPRAARRWVARLVQGATVVLKRTTVFDAPDARCLAALRPDGSVLQIRARRLVLAPGARDRFVPYPGWTLPGALGVGGAQALVKAGASFAGLKVVVAGTGPLLLPAASALARSGGQVVVVAEQAPRGSVLAFGLGLLDRPTRVSQAIRYVLTARAPYRPGWWVSAARGQDRVGEATLTDGRRERTVACDALACSYGLVPNLELARLLGCECHAEAVVVDDLQTTTVAGVWAAGEITGIGGAELALVEGRVAGLAATDRLEEAQALHRRRERERAFAQRLERTFALRPEVKALPDAATIVCRCEDVRYGDVVDLGPRRKAKLLTRAGMGPCQGRICGPSLDVLFGWEADRVRPPLFPVTIEALKEDTP